MPTGRTLPRHITRRISLARALLVWERLWAGLWTAAALTGLFVATALLGTFSTLPLAVHWGLLGAFGFLLAIALWNGLRGFRWPDRAAALTHLETASGLNHQPLSAYEDIAASGSGDPVLWQAHQSWIAVRLKKLKLGFVTPGLVTRDPYGLRAIVILLLVVLNSNPSVQMMSSRCRLAACFHYARTACAISHLLKPPMMIAADRNR